MALKKIYSRLVCSPSRVHGTVVFLGVLLVFLQYNPVWLHADRVFFGGKDDGNLCFFVYSWGLETIGKGDWSLFWNPPFFHPNRMVGAYTENTLLPIVMGLIPYWISGSALISYNAVIFANLVLFFIGICLFGALITGSKKAGLFAALCAICADFLMVQSGHAQNLFIGTVPFVFLFIFAWYRTRRTRYVWWYALTLSATAWSNLYYFTFCLFLSVVTALCFCIAGRCVISWRDAAKTLFPAAAGALSVLPVLYPYIAIGKQITEQRGTFYAPAIYSANLLDFIGVKIFSTNWETTVFMGPVFTFLIAVSIWFWFVRAREHGWKWRTILRPVSAIDTLHLAGILLVVLGVTAAVACGPAIRLGRWWLINPNPAYALFYYLIPGAHGIRAIGRIMLVAIPLLSVLCAEGFLAAIRNMKNKRIVAGIVAAFIVSTSQFIPTAFGKSLLTTDVSELKRPGKAMVAWFRANDTVRVLALFPFAGTTPDYAKKRRDDWESQNLWFSTILKRPIINGYSGYFPPSFTGMISLWKKEEYRFTDALATSLRALDVDAIIVDRSLFPSFEIASVHPRFRYQREASGDQHAVFTVE